MRKPTSVPPGTPSKRALQFRSATDGHRVIYHEPICAECESFDVDKADVPTGGGLTELALVCGCCGAAWPLACVADWDTPDDGGQ